MISQSYSSKIDQIKSRLRIILITSQTVDGTQCDTFNKSVFKKCHLCFCCLLCICRSGSQTQETSRKCWMLSSRWTWTNWTSKPLSSLEVQTVGREPRSCMLPHDGVILSSLQSSTGHTCWSLACIPLYMSLSNIWQHSTSNHPPFRPPPSSCNTPSVLLRWKPSI